MEYIDPKITKIAPLEGYDNTTKVKWDRKFIDKWQYHVTDLNEFLEIKKGELTIEFAKAYNLKDAILPEGSSSVTPNLLIHRLRSNGPVKLNCSFKKPWKQEQEPLFKTEMEAWASFYNYFIYNYINMEL